MDRKQGFSTRALHSDKIDSNWPGDPVVCPISLSTTFQQESPGKTKGYEYSRSGNPTRDALEKSLAVLENAKHALSFSSGLAAENCVLHLLKAGDEILCVDDVYGGTNRLMNRVFNSFNIVTKMIDMSSLKLIKDALNDKIKIVWIETPTNPTLKIVDIKGIKQVIAESKKEIILVADNTFMTPYFQQPLDLGADIVIHSLTKYINGHSDVVMGGLMINNDELYNKLKFYQNAIGSVPSPFDCYLVLRGIKTLAIRMERHQSNAIKVATHFKDHPKIQDIIYPGLESFPQRELIKKQASGYGGMVSLRLKADVESTKKFLSSLKIFSLAESLGGFESLAEHPAIMTHAAVPLEQRKLLGIGDNFVRLSIGLEDAEDLIEDIENALKSI